jgi:hemoglobin-like flavoprotein
MVDFIEARGPRTFGRATIMTPDQILLVQTSFQMTGADGTALARSLGTRLDTPAAPLASLLVLAVRGLSRRRVLQPALRRLMARHPAIGRAALHGPSVAAALVEAVEEALGAPLPRSAAAAWHAWYGLTVSLLQPGIARPRCS